MHFNHILIQFHVSLLKHISGRLKPVQRHQGWKQGSSWKLTTYFHCGSDSQQQVDMFLKLPSKRAFVHDTPEGDWPLVYASRLLVKGGGVLIKKVR